MSGSEHKDREDEMAHLLIPKVPVPFHVFHIDDSPDDHLLLRAAADAAGVDCTWDVAESADSAIFYLRTLLAVDGTEVLKRPDLVLLDVSLPGGSGFRVLELIRSTPELNSLRVVVLSGSNSPDVLERAYLLGANSILVKPSAFRELVNLVTSLRAAWDPNQCLSANLSPFAEPSLLAGHRA